ncbi:MAG: tail fiber domain-containing protein, partial [Patescibacteria group bacterium]
WAPGGPPQAAPGDGNVFLEEVLWTKNGPAKIFYNGGKVGIGTTTPGDNWKLDVIANTDGSHSGGIRILGDESITAGVGRARISFEDAGTQTRWNVGTFGDASYEGGDKFGINLSYFEGVYKGLPKFIIDSNGNVGIGTTAPTQKLDVAGNVRATSFLYSSDASLKENVEIIPDALNKIERLEGVSFSWKENGQVGLGLIAQDVEAVFPELVSTDAESKLKSVQYGNLVAPLIEAVKEQQEQIENQQIEIEKMQVEIGELKESVKN